MNLLAVSERGIVLENGYFIRPNGRGIKPKLILNSNIFFGSKIVFRKFTFYYLLNEFVTIYSKTTFLTIILSFVTILIK